MMSLPSRSISFTWVLLSFTWVLLCGAGALDAQTATTTFDVSITINADCVIATPSALAFPATGVLSTAVTATTDLDVTCTAGTAYQIGLDAGQGTGATTTTRLMTQGADTIAYQLFRDAGLSLNWGNAPGVDTLAATGNGTTQSFPVYGQVPAQTTPATGVYTDQITVTLTY